MITVRRFQINWKIGLFTLIMLPVLIALGFWQLAREDEKRALQQRYESRAGAAPVSLAQAQAMEDPSFMPVRVSGRYRPERSFLLDNSIHEGRPGYEVITPLRTEDDRVVLINRGWVPMGRSRESLPAIEAPDGSVDIRATVYVPLGEAVMLGEESAFQGWPRRLQKVDPTRMYRELEAGESTRFPYTLRLAEGEPGVFARPWQAVNVSPARHRGYAVQWFTMALALIGLFVYVSLPRRKSEQRSGKSE